MSKFFLKENTGKPSVTLTAFVLGFIVVNFKLIFSGMELGGLKLSEFSGVDFAACMTSLGAIYVMRRNWDKKSDDSSKKE